MLLIWPAKTEAALPPGDGHFVFPLSWGFPQLRPATATTRVAICPSWPPQLGLLPDTPTLGGISGLPMDQYSLKTNTPPQLRFAAKTSWRRGASCSNSPAASDGGHMFRLPPKPCSAHCSPPALPQGRQTSRNNSAAPCSTRHSARRKSNPARFTYNTCIHCPARLADAPSHPCAPLGQHVHFLPGQASRQVKPGRLQYFQLQLESRCIFLTYTC